MKLVRSARTLIPAAVLALAALFAMAAPPAGDDFVTRSGHRLMLRGKPFRFAGANLDYLVLASDSFGKFGSDDMYYPSKYMVDDAFQTLENMGGLVSRVWSSASQGCKICIKPALGKFNEEALRQLDYVVYSAGEHHIRLILLFVDPWGFYTGGEEQYKQWRGAKDFYADPAVVSDYKLYIDTLIHRRNSYNGIVYKDDPAILGWQAGNELDAPIGWQRSIGAYIKRADPKHLLIGSCGLMHGDKLAACAAVPELDVIDVHYYPYLKVPWKYDEDKALAMKAGKAFIVGEFGWDKGNLSIDELKAKLQMIEADPEASGDMFWALRANKGVGEPMPVPTPGDNGPKDGSNWSPGGAADGRWWALYYEGVATNKNTAEDMHQRALILAAHAKNMAGQINK